MTDLWVRLVVCVFGVLVTKVWVWQDEDESPELEFVSDYYQCGKNTSEKQWKPCFKEICKCCNDTADCSRSNLKFVPKLPSYVTFLNFSSNNLHNIEDEDFFLNVTNITVLDLGKNNLTHLGPSVFKHLTSLTILLLNFNKMNCSDCLEAIFSVKTLVHLEIRHSNIDHLPQDFFHTHPMPNLTKLYLHENQLGKVCSMINLTIFQPLPSLSFLALSTNMFSTVLTLVPMGIQKLELQSNGLFDFPQTCLSGSRESIYPDLEELYLMENLIRYLPSGDDEICLHNLTVLQLNGNHISHFYSGMFRTSLFPKLYILLLRQMNTKMQEIHAQAFNNSKLTILSLQYNHLEFGNANVVSRSSFDGLPNLSRLEVDFNDFHTLNESQFLQLFGRLHSLRNLTMGSTFYKDISPNTFRSFRSLSLLAMHKNDLAQIPDGTFDDLENLTMLYLYNNQISLVRSSTFSESLCSRLKVLDLHENPFLCSCDLLWFQNWFKNNRPLFQPHRNLTLSGQFPSNRYECNNDPKNPLLTFSIPDQVCLLSHDAYTFVFVSVNVLLVTLTIFVIMYRYRWHIRLLLYESFRGGAECQKSRLQSRRFKYDIFVSYAAEDLNWVLTHLMPELEGRLRLRLCVHQRDFLPGRNIVDNIANAVEASKKVLMVFSSHFARSHWCQFELSLCLRHVMDTEDQLVVVYLNDIPMRDLTAAMHAVLKTTTMIEWKDEMNVEQSFIQTQNVLSTRHSFKMYRNATVCRDKQKIKIINTKNIIARVEV